jgi:4-diphosphocytidyl-2-C-methyl-D-erythritol kinase
VSRPYKLASKMKSQQISLRSYAKINTGLHILGKREDGYHEIRTIFQTVNLYDRLEIALTQGRKVEFTSDDRELDPRHNLVVKAILSLSRFKKLDKGYRIHLEKKIPVGAGLGGGSSNAAAAIHGISRLLNLNLSHKELFEIGGALGSDVPFFFVGGTALGVGSGAEVYPLEDQPEKYLLLIVPGYAISTVDAYARVTLPLTKKIKKSMIPAFCPGYLDSLDQGNFTGNDFEKVAFRDFPRLKGIKKKLLDRGAVAAGLTGSGSALFGLFNSREELLKARDAIASKEFQIIQTNTLSRKQYWNCLVESLQ